jgi:hypothetical protein
MSASCSDCIERVQALSREAESSAHPLCAAHDGFSRFVDRNADAQPALVYALCTWRVPEDVAGAGSYGSAAFPACSGRSAEI